MKKCIFILSFSLLMSSCYTSTSQQSAGTMAGAMLGSSIGSLFGGLIDGPRGDWWGTAVGTIAGAAIGNAINSPASKTRTQTYVEPENDEAYMPQNDGQDVVAQQLDIRNIKFVDENHDLKINPGEHCQLLFEIYNTGSQSVTNIVPMVTVTSQKKHIFMSQPVRIERLDAGNGLRYTLSIYSDKGLKTGNVGFEVYLSADGYKQQLMRTFELPCEKLEF